MAHLNPNSKALPHWLYEAPYQQATDQPLPSEADIVIVGGGITGLSTAYWLKQLNPKKSVVVLEARGIASGATGHNGGIICPGAYGRFDFIADRFGEEEAFRLVNFDYTNMDMLAQFLEIHGDKDNGPYDPQIRWLKNGTICAWTSEAEAQEGQANGACIQKARPDQDDIAMLTAEEVQALTGEKSFRWGGMQVKRTATAWAARIVFCLARAVEDKVHLATFSPVEKVERDDPNHLRVTTPRGTILTKQVAYCTNAWTKHLVPHFNPYLPGPGAKDARAIDYVLICNRIHEYMNYRNHDDRIIFGGMLDVTEAMGHDDDSELDEKISRHLRDRLKEMGLPHRPEREWIGIIGYSVVDGLPFVGDLSTVLGREKAQGQFIAAGFSGHGMPRTYLCGRALAQLMLNEPLDAYFPTPFLLDHPTRKYLLSSDAKVK